MLRASRRSRANRRAVSTEPSCAHSRRASGRAKQNATITGATATGKTFLGTALARASCRSGNRALCTRAPRLLHELSIARGDGSYTTMLQKIARADVRVLDALLIAPLEEQERRDLLEVLEDRYDRASTVITTQVPTKKLASPSQIPRSPTRSAIE